MAVVAIAVLVASLMPARAFADATVFAGIASAPSARPAIGVAIGGGLIIVGFEFEYAQSGQDIEELAPLRRTFMGNLLVQTPFAVSGVQLYGTVGAGFFRESFGEDVVLPIGARDSETNVGTNIGGGAKIRLAGPLRVRLDYRLFMLNDAIAGDRSHRFYAGLNIGF